MQRWLWAGLPHCFSALFQGRGLGASDTSVPSTAGKKNHLCPFLIRGKKTQTVPLSLPHLWETLHGALFTCTSRDSMVLVMLRTLACTPAQELVTGRQNAVWLFYLSAPSLGSGKASVVEGSVSPRTPSGPVLLRRCWSAPPRPTDALPGRRTLAKTAPQARWSPCPQHLCGPVPQCPQPGKSGSGVEV